MKKISLLVFRKNIFRILLLNLLLCIGCISSFAAPGDLDTTFGNGGKVLTSFGDSGDSANAVAIQSDGKIVAVGTSALTF